MARLLELRRQRWPSGRLCIHGGFVDDLLDLEYVDELVRQCRWLLHAMYCTMLDCVPIVQIYIILY